MFPRVVSSANKNKKERQGSSQWGGLMWKPLGSLAAAVLSRPWLAISSFIPEQGGFINFIQLFSGPFGLSGSLVSLILSIASSPLSRDL